MIIIVFYFKRITCTKHVILKKALLKYADLVYF